jgi:hypothetical protein
MSLERVDSVDPTEVYDYIICGYVDSMPQIFQPQTATDPIVEAERLAASLLDV